MNGSVVDMTLEQLDFFTEETTLEIIPMFTQKEPLELMGVDLLNPQKSIGPFKAGNPTKVPAWVAFNLHRSRKGKISPPDILSENYVEERLGEEKARKDQLMPLDFQFFDILRLFESRYDDFIAVDRNAFRTSRR